MTLRTLFIVRSWLVLAVALVPAWCFAAKTTKTTTSSYQPQQETADLFEAIDAGQIEVKFIAKNEKQARVRIKNKSGKPLSVRLPEAFAARPVLAQILPFGRGLNAGGPGGGSQNLGSTFNGGQNNGNNQNAAGANFFNVPAEKTAELRVPCVCLDYGKPTPRAAIPYELVPLETVCDKPSLAALLASLDNSNQQEIQAAAWHIANDMTWQELAAARIEHLLAPSELLFTAKELKCAKELLDDATSLATSEHIASDFSTSAAASN